MAQKPVLRGEVGCACVAREVSVERGGMAIKSNQALSPSHFRLRLLSGRRGHHRARRRSPARARRVAAAAQSGTSRRTPISAVVTRGPQLDNRCVPRSCASLFSPRSLFLPLNLRAPQVTPPPKKKRRSLAWNDDRSTNRNINSHHLGRASSPLPDRAGGFHSHLHYVGSVVDAREVDETAPDAAPRHGRTEMHGAAHDGG